jgi:hypothetical protein
MKKFLLSLSVGLLALAVTPRGLAAAPKSVEELQVAAESALKAQDVGAFRALFNHQGVTAAASTAEQHIFAGLERFYRAHGTNEFRVAVRRLPLPEDMEMENVINGVRFRPNLPPLGMLNCHLGGLLDGTNNSWGMTMPYGQTNGEFGFVGTLTEKVYEPKQKENLYSIAIDSGLAGTAAGFAAECVYVQNGLTLTNRFHGHQHFRKVMAGDELKSCVVQPATAGPAIITLALFKAAWDGAAYTNTLIFSGHTTATNNVIRFP